MTQTEKLDTTQTFKLSEQLLLKEDGNDILAFDPTNLSVHQFNASLALIAKSCDGSSTCEEIVLKIAEVFDLSIDDAAKEVYRGLKILDQHDLLEAA